MRERSGDQFPHLSTEVRRIQNSQAFVYLQSLLGQDDSRIFSQIPTIEIKLMPGHRSIQVIYEAPQWSRGLVVGEEYWVSDEGLLAYLIEEEHRLRSGLTYRRKEYKPVRTARDELDLLPEGADSMVTAAKFIANDIRLRLEGRPRGDRVL